MIDPQPDLELTAAQAERLLEAWLGGSVTCTSIVPLSGGLINTVLRLEFDRAPHEAVVKLHESDSDTFAAEARSLHHLGTETTCPVPDVYLRDGSARLIPHAFLLLECVPGVCLDSVDLEPAERADVDRQLAAVLVELHGHTGTSWGGLDADPASRGWGDVFTDRLVDARAYPVLNERLSADVLAQVDRAIDGAATALRDSGPPTLVHGDIWDGNLMARRADGRWQLTGFLDPDAQFADSECELAYLEVFDNERPVFFAAYQEHRSLRPGYERRRLFYWLHTALIHVALFEDEFFREFTARTAASIERLD